MSNVLISAHALDRFIERIGIKKSRESAEKRMRARLECAYRLRGQYWYSGGLIYCIKNNVCTTVMKPGKLRTQTLVNQNCVKRTKPSTAKL